MGETGCEASQTPIRTKAPIPPLAEQQGIAAFLDRHTARIDTLIEKQQRLVALLAEKRQAVINIAVTKGLNPSAPMKDSGVEWLGQVPAHWEVKRLKYLATMLSGGTPSKENFLYWDGDIPWASSKDLKSDFLNDTQDHITQLAIDCGASATVAPNSILVVVRGMILARTFPVSMNLLPMCINQDLKAITPRKPMDANYMAFVLRGTSDETLARTGESGHGTKALRMGIWLQLELPVPPLCEQREACQFLDVQLGKIDALTEKGSQSIALMKERRAALISAAVTGKIDVREAA